jgi:hypothetical protein
VRDRGPEAVRVENGMDTLRELLKTGTPRDVLRHVRQFKASGLGVL